MYLNPLPLLLPTLPFPVKNYELFDNRKSNGRRRKGKTSDIQRMPVFSPLTELWKGFGKEKERKRIYCENALNSAKRQQGFLFGYAENDRFFAVF